MLQGIHKPPGSVSLVTEPGWWFLLFFFVNQIKWDDWTILDPKSAAFPMISSSALGWWLSPCLPWGGWPTAKATNPTNAPIPRPLGPLGLLWSNVFLMWPLGQPNTTQVQKMQKKSSTIREFNWSILNLFNLFSTGILGTIWDNSFYTSTHFDQWSGDAGDKESARADVTPALCLVCNWSCPMGTSLPSR